MKAALLIISAGQIGLAAWTLTVVYRAYGCGNQSDLRLARACAALGALAAAQMVLVLLANR